MCDDPGHVHAAVANVAPRECCDIWRLARAGQWDEAREIVYRLSLLATGISRRYGIGGLKAAQDLLGYYGGLPRLPVYPCARSQLLVMRNVTTMARLTGIGRRVGENPKVHLPLSVTEFT